MRNLIKVLKDRFSGSKRVAVLGVGSDLRADDISGMLVSEQLKERLTRKKSSRAVKIFFGGTAPENLTGEIKKFKPTHLLIIDTIDCGKKAGSIYLFKPEEIAQGASFSTHKMPAKVLVDYLVSSCGCGATILGIQPKTIEFGKKVTPAVLSSVKKLSSALADILCG